jgi:hypothetical protein
MYPLPRFPMAICCKDEQEHIGKFVFFLFFFVGVGNSTQGFTWKAISLLLKAQLQSILLWF